MNPSIEELTDRYLRGDLTDAEVATFEQRLRDDDAGRAQFRRAARLEANLRSHAVVRQSEVAAWAASGARVKTTPAESLRSSLWHWRSPLAAAAAVVLGLAAFWWSQRGVEVEVVQASGAVLDEWRTGNKLHLNQVTMVRGSVQMRLSSGVLLDVAAPVEMKLLDAMHVRVLTGRVTADVGEHGKGFVIETEQARVVDLGTKFGVDVAEAGHTDVVVFQGEVKLFERQAGHMEEAAMTRLVEGEAVRVDARQQLSRIVNVTSAVNSSGWSTRGDDARSVIASVRDNLRDPGAKNYYRIVSGGLREDVRAFVGQRHEWNGLDASGLPAELLGADLVQTFVTDRSKTALEITVTVSGPAVVYVLFDSRIAPPAWLAKSFTDTGTRIGLENAPLLDSGHTVAVGPGAGNMAPFAVWKRELPQAGSITLGPPRQSPDQRLLWMYGIAAKPL